MHEFQAVILAAGKGTRLGVQSMPKVLIPLKNKPIIKYLLESLGHIQELQNPLIVVGFLHEEVEKALGNKYRYVFQPEQLGTAHAVLSAKPEISAENLMVLHGDTPFLDFKDLENLMVLHKQNHSPVTMFTCRVPNFENEYGVFNNFGRILRAADGSIKKIIELADASEEEMQISEINPAVYIFKSQWLWDKLVSIGNKNNLSEFYLTDIVEQAILDHQSVSSLEVDPWKTLGINTQEDLSLAESLV